MQSRQGGAGHARPANPVGFAALDIKSLYMGATGGSWADTRSSRMRAVLNPRLAGGHKALQDATYQAVLFRLTRNILRHD